VKLNPTSLIRLHSTQRGIITSPAVVVVVVTAVVVIVVVVSFKIVTAHTIHQNAWSLM